MLVYQNRWIALWAEGLDEAEGELTLRSACQRCGHTIVARTYRVADYASLDALAEAAIGAQGAGDALAVLAHASQCPGRGR